MIARAITAIIGVVIGLFATFAVFSAILGGLDSFYLLTQDACNYGSLNSPKRALRAAPENPEHPGDADEIDWTRDGVDLVHDGQGGCDIEGDATDATYLTPTGDELPVAGSAVASTPQLSGPEFTLPTTRRPTSGIYLDGDDVYYVPFGSTLARYSISANTVTTAFDLSNSGQAIDVWLTDNLVYVLHGDGEMHVHDRATGNRRSDLEFNPGHRSGIFFLTDTHVYIRGAGRKFDAYRLSDNSRDEERDLTTGLTENNHFLFGGYYDGHYTYYIVNIVGVPSIWIVRGLTSLEDAWAAGTALHRPLDPNFHSDNSPKLRVVDHRYAYVIEQYAVYIVDLGELPVSELDWIPAEDVFTAQERLVTLLAVIAAIGMPIGAMTAIVFFGQAVLSSGMTGQGASQVLVAIAAVVIILVSIQMFQQFAGFLGTAFDAVNGDRFVVFDEALGSLAETIAEFWGVLAFAGFINIATIVWRNYSGNFSIGGNQGGL